MPQCYQCGEEVKKVKIRGGRVMCQACIDDPTRGPSSEAKPAQNPFEVKEQEEQRSGWRDWLPGWKTLLIVVVVGFLASTFFGGEDKAPTPMTKDTVGPALKDQFSDVSKVEVHEPLLHVRYIESGGFSDSSWVKQAGYNTMRMCKFMSGRLNFDCKEVVFWVQSEMVDKFGNATDPATLIRITWDVSAIDKVNYDNFYGNKFLNLASEVQIVHPEGRRFMIAFCQDEDHGQDARQFCLLAARQN